MDIQEEPSNHLTFWELKQEVLDRFLLNLDRSKLARVRPGVLRFALRLAVDRICAALNPSLDPVTRDMLVNKIFAELVREPLPE